jgi:FkbM family methyltransferase
MFNSQQARVQSAIARSRVGVWCVVKVGNQCKAIVGRAHGSTVTDMTVNGEETILKHLGGSVRFAIDVGANRGEWTQIALRNTAAESCLLFEPSSSALTYLGQRFAGESRVKIVPSAAGDSVGHLTFYEEAGAGETSTLVAGASSQGKACTVPVTTLETEIDRLGWPTVDYLKIDAEGYDFHVLRGARQLLEDKRVALGQFEYEGAWAHSGSTLAYAIKWLNDLGYQCFLLKNRKLYRPRPEVYGEYFEYSNYVFCHEETKSLIASLICGAV